MRTRFDGLAKDALGATLDIASAVSLQQGVSADTQYMDVSCEPDPSRAHERRRLGLLGRMIEERCSLEPYHEPPDEEELFACIRKQLTWHHGLTRKARAADPGAKMVTLPVQWILSAGRASKAMEHFDLAVLGDGWPAGVYTAVKWLRLRLVVISELPRTRETLLLRLLGAGSTLRAAMAELMALPPDAWERRTLVPLFVKFRFDLPPDPAQRTPDEEEFVVTAQQYVEAIRDEGRDEGMEELIVHISELRLKRPLRDAERATLRARVNAAGAKHVAGIVSGLDGDELAAWLATQAG